MEEQKNAPEGMEEKFENLPEEYSHLYMAIEGKLAAVICIEDPLREEAVEVIRELRKAGLSKIVMMTGDSERTAKAIAKELGIYEENSKAITGTELDNMTDDELDKIVENTSVFARVSPNHKLRIVNSLKRSAAPPR